MARHLYSVVFYLLTPFIILRLLWRSRANANYRQGMLQRFGFGLPAPQKNTVWIHCVSVGETLAAAPLIEALLKTQSHHILITNTTPTGADQTQRLFSDRVSRCYAPYDLPSTVARFLKHVKPILAIAIETEVWPNTIKQCQQFNIPTVLVNARMSAKSFKGYQRIAALAQPMFKQLSLATTQTEADQLRIKALGAKNTIITGSIKNDFRVTDIMLATASEEKQQLGSHRLCLIAASTHEGEDGIILDAFKMIHAQHPKALLILVPRHPERFESVYTLSREAGFETIKRSINTPQASTQVIIGDTMGELQMLYGTADIAIMGGTFIDHGGHNFLEPAAWGLPTISGESTFNFAGISKALTENQGLTLVDNAQSLANAALTLIEDETERAKRGKAAKDYVEQNRGAVNATLAALTPFLGGR